MPKTTASVQVPSFIPDHYIHPIKFPTLQDAVDESDRIGVPVLLSEEYNVDSPLVVRGRATLHGLPNSTIRATTDINGIVRMSGTTSPVSGDNRPRLTGRMNIAGSGTASIGLFGDRLSQGGTRYIEELRVNGCSLGIALQRCQGGGFGYLGANFNVQGFLLLGNNSSTYEKISAVNNSGLGLGIWATRFDSSPDFSMPAVPALGGGYFSSGLKIGHIKIETNGSGVELGSENPSIPASNSTTPIAIKGGWIEGNGGIPIRVFGPQVICSFSDLRTDGSVGSSMVQLETNTSKATVNIFGCYHGANSASSFNPVNDLGTNNKWQAVGYSGSNFSPENTGNI